MATDRCDLLCLDLELAERLRHGRLEPERAEAAASAAKALGDPTRLTLAHALGQADEACVCDLSWVLERSENLVSHHLKVLRQAGLVASRREGKMVLYALTDRGAELLAATVAERAGAQA